MTEEIYPRIVVSIPQYKTGTPDDECFYGFTRIIQQGWYVIPTPATRCDNAHNNAVIAVLIHNAEMIEAGEPERTYTHLVTLDADHVHPPNTVHHLAGVVKGNPEKYRVVAGLNFRRGKPWDPTLFIEGDDGRLASMAEWPQGIGPVSHAGTAAMIIDMSIFPELSFPFFGYSYDHARAADWPNCTPWDLDRARFPGVDMWFCDRCHEADIQIWGDTRLTAPHLGKAWIDERQWMAYQKTDEFKWEHATYSTRLAMIEEHVPELFEGGQRILYVGANKNRAHYAKELKDAGNTLHLLEIDAGNVNLWVEKEDSPFDYYYINDIREGLLIDYGSYDVVFWWHGPEHIQRDELDLALKHNCENAVKPGGLVVVGCPWGEGPDGNVLSPYDKHVSAWYPEDFTQRGYRAVVGGQKDSGYSSLLAWKRKPKE